ncbi:MAG: alpha/beta hydrolase-fold protein [bacterium]|nr:alpha/beta hydrolase-fold protein [bacterium]
MAWLVCMGPTAWAQPSPACEAITRLLPPAGQEPAPEQLSAWQVAMQRLNQELASLDNLYRADVEVLIKACELAIRHREFYRDADFAKVDSLLELAETRLAELQADQVPSWKHAAGNQVRGYRSSVDGSAQPLGLVLPERSEEGTQYPLYVWLHGRGDKTTDLHFIHERLSKEGQVQPEGAIVLHPFGRQCVGYKSAGETDVLEAIDFVCANYPIDERRIVLMGFSMGGAGVWHLAAHYGDRFCAASPGAGFAETARYQNLKSEQFPPEYEQILWRVYDVPNYVRNLFNFPVVAYSGENDKQIQAARVMEEAYQGEGRQLTHLIGPGMGHKYHPDTLAEILQRMQRAAESGKPLQSSEFSIQSPHQRYAKYAWVSVDGVQQQYADTRVDASRDEQSGWKLNTRNVQRLVLDAGKPGSPQASVVIDSQLLGLQAGKQNRFQRESDGTWRSVESFPAIRKHPGISGPIDDAFIDAFLVVEPSGSSGNADVDRWVACELEYLRDRWRSLFRGELRSKLDREVNAEDMKNYHLVLWGTPSSNLVMKKIMSASNGNQGEGQESASQGGEASGWAGGLEWSEERVGFDNRYSAANHVPLFITPNPLNPERYVVVNSGPTFRSAHDRTNSLQNPHLPDWAILSLDEPRSAERGGRVVEAGFFNDRWQLDAELTWQNRP